MRNIGRCVGKFGWQDVSGGVIKELSETDVKGMLLSVAWRMPMPMPMMKRITECEVNSSCAFMKSKAERRIMLKLRGGMAAFSD